MMEKIFYYNYFKYKIQVKFKNYISYIKLNKICIVITNLNKISKFHFYKIFIKKKLKFKIIKGNGNITHSNNHEHIKISVSDNCNE